MLKPAIWAELIRFEAQKQETKAREEKKKKVRLGLTSLFTYISSNAGTGLTPSKLGKPAWRIAVGK